MDAQIFARKTTVYREILPRQTFLYRGSKPPPPSPFFPIKKFVSYERILRVLSPRKSILYAMITMITKQNNYGMSLRKSFKIKRISNRHKNKNVRHREYRSSIRSMLSLVFALHSCHAFVAAAMEI